MRLRLLLLLSVVDLFHSAANLTTPCFHLFFPFCLQKMLILLPLLSIFGNSLIAGVGANLSLGFKVIRVSYADKQINKIDAFMNYIT